MSDMNNPADDNNGAMDDLWAEALSEQKSTSGKSRRGVPAIWRW